MDNKYSLRRFGNTKEEYQFWTTRYANNYNVALFPFTTEIAYTPVDEMNRCLSYYFGLQGAQRNYPIIQNNTILQNLDSRNNQIFQLVNALHGKMSEFMAKFNISTEILSQNATTAKDQFRTMLLFEVEHADILAQFTKLGGQYPSVKPKDVILQNKDDIDAYMEDYRDEGADVAELIGKASCKINDYVNMQPKRFLDLLIMGASPNDRWLENGIVMEEKKDPRTLIWDNRHGDDDNFNSKAWYRGFFENLITTDEGLNKYERFLSADQIKDIENLSSGQCDAQYFQTYSLEFPQANAGNSFSWWQGDNKGISLWSNVRMYFKAWTEYEESKSYDEKGNVIKGGCYRWHQATKLFGKYIVDEGVVPNAFYEHLNVGQQVCPAQVYIDENIGGFFRSRVSRLTDLQDDYNLATIKRNSKMVRDLGINYLLKNIGGDSEPKKDKEGKVVGVIQDIYSKFSSQGMAAIKQNPNIDPEMLEMKFAEEVDFGKEIERAPFYENIKLSIVNEMSNLMTLPPIVQGLQQTTIGKGVQQGTTELAAVGIAPLFNGFVSSIQKGLQLTGNMQKLAFLSPDANEDYVRMIVGDNGYVWLKDSLERLYEQMGIYIKPYDQIDAIKMASLQQDIQAGMQSGVITFENSLVVKSYTSYSDAIRYIKRVSRQNKLANDQAAAQASQQAAMAQDKQIQADLQAKQYAPDAVKYKADQDNQQSAMSNIRDNQRKAEDTNKLVLAQIEKIRAEMKRHYNDKVIPDAEHPKPEKAKA